MDINNSTTPEEAPDMDNNLRDDEPALNTIGDDEKAEQQIKKGGNVLVNSATESLELELPSGIKVSLSSGAISVTELAGLCVWLLKEIKEKKVNGKSTGSYVG